MFSSLSWPFSYYFNKNITIIIKIIYNYIIYLILVKLYRKRRSCLMNGVCIYWNFYSSFLKIISQNNFDMVIWLTLSLNKFLFMKIFLNSQRQWYIVVWILYLKKYNIFEKSACKMLLKQNVKVLFKIFLRFLLFRWCTLRYKVRYKSQFFSRWFHPLNMNS